MLHLLVARGAKWLPVDKNEIADTRQNLLKMKREYVLEFVWLMQNYQAARRSDVKELLRTAAIVRLLGEERDKADELLARVPDDVGEATTPGWRGRPPS